MKMLFFSLEIPIFFFILLAFIYINIIFQYHYSVFDLFFICSVCHDHCFTFNTVYLTHYNMNNYIYYQKYICVDTWPSLALIR